MTNVTDKLYTTNTNLNSNSNTKANTNSKTNTNTKTKTKTKTKIKTKRNKYRYERHHAIIITLFSTPSHKQNINKQYNLCFVITSCAALS